MDLREQLKPLDAEAKRTGVNYLPESVVNDDWSRDNWHFAYSQDAARMIAEAFIARTLRKYGRAVYRTPDGVWWSTGTHRGPRLDNATDDLTAMIAAMRSLYATLPDAAKGGE